MKKCFLPFGLILVLSLNSCTPSPQTDSSVGGESVATAEPDTDAAANVDTDTDTPRGGDSDDSANTDIDRATNVDGQTSVLPEVGTYTLDELLEVDGGGCGMSLSRSQGDNNLFSSGLDGDAFMEFDGQLTPLGRSAAKGDIEFYGQKTAQTFVTSDGEITVQVDVTLGAPGEIEGVDIPEGTITIKAQGESLEIPVVGSAGC